MGIVILGARRRVNGQCEAWRVVYLEKGLDIVLNDEEKDVEEVEEKVLGVAVSGTRLVARWAELELTVTTTLNYVPVLWFFQYSQQLIDDDNEQREKFGILVPPTLTMSAKTTHGTQRVPPVNVVPADNNWGHINTVGAWSIYVVLHITSSASDRLVSPNYLSMDYPQLHSTNICQIQCVKPAACFIKRSLAYAHEEGDS